MKKDFDFDDIGKRTPYRTPDGFFEDVQRKVMERAGVKQQRKSHTKLIISTVITIAAVWEGSDSPFGRISVCSVFATGR